MRSPANSRAARRSAWPLRKTPPAKPPGPRTVVASSPLLPLSAPRPRQHLRQRANRSPPTSLGIDRRHGRHGRHRQFSGRLHPVHRFRLRPRAGRCPLARRRAHRYRHHARRPLLGDGAGRGRPRAIDQENALYRCLRFHNQQLQQPRQDHLQLLRRPRHRGQRRDAEPGAAPSARAHRSGRRQRRSADSHRDLRADGLRQLLRQFRPDRHPARRLDDRRRQLLHHGDPALRQPDRVQADDLGGLRPRALRPVRPHRLPRREGAGQRGLVGREDPRPRRDRRHRLDDLRSVHQRPQQSPDHQRRPDPDPRGSVDARPHHLRTRHRQRSHRRRAAARRRRGGRNGAGRRRHRRRRGRARGGRSQRRRRRDRGDRTCGSVCRRRRRFRLQRGRARRRREGWRLGRHQARFVAQRPASAQAPRRRARPRRGERALRPRARQARPSPPRSRPGRGA